jgi:hypothetical protein
MGSSADHLVSCQCGARLRVPASAAGKRIRCPKCSYRIEIGADGLPAMAGAAAEPGEAPPQPAPSATSPPQARPADPPPPVADEGDDLLSDFMESESGAETSAGPDLAASQKSCPECSAAMPKGAVTCIACGWESGKGQASPARAAASASSAKNLAVGGGKFALGCALSGGGALLAAGIWYAVAVFANFEIGYIAWAVGLFAGFGMLWGYGKQDFAAAVVATGMALAGILAAKKMIHYHYVGNLPVVANDAEAVAIHWGERQCSEPFQRRGCPIDRTNVWQSVVTFGRRSSGMGSGEFESRRAELAAWANETRWNDTSYADMILAHNFARDRWQNEDATGDAIDDDEWNEQAELRLWNDAYAEAVARVEKMTPEERMSRARTAEQESEQEAIQGEKFMAEILGEVGFFKTMFSPIDGIFILLALGTAMKIGGGQED